MRRVRILQTFLILLVLQAIVSCAHFNKNIQTKKDPMFDESYVKKKGVEKNSLRGRLISCRAENQKLKMDLEEAAARAPASFDYFQMRKDALWLKNIRGTLKRRGYSIVVKGRHVYATKGGIEYLLKDGHVCRPLSIDP